MTFTLEDVLNAAREVVAERGEDYVYSNSLNEGGSGKCVYANEDGTPSCLVGHVIHRLDPNVFKNLAEKEFADDTTAAELLTVEEYVPTDFWEMEAEAAMNTAQAYQDDGLPWGTALKAAGA